MFSVDNHVQCINQNKCNVPKVPQNPDVTFVIFKKKKKDGTQKNYINLQMLVVQQF